MPHSALLKPRFGALVHTLKLTRSHPTPYTGVQDNVLDDRVPEGKDEGANVVVAEWGAEKRKMGEGFLWHDDDIASKEVGTIPPPPPSCLGRVLVC